jgi:hypothetical protein
METSGEIKSAINNLKYYSKRIAELARQQFDLDFETGNKIGMNIEPGSKRFECLAAAIAGTEWIETYCHNIESNIKHAEELDEEIRIKKEELGIED